jgi:GT2 family glycosyltransferase
MFMKEIDVSIIIVTYNTEQITYECIESVLASVTKYKYEVIVIDNNSSDNTVERLNKNFSSICVISSPINLGFSKGNNIGIDKSTGKYILLLNSDTLLFKSSLDDLLNAAIKNNYQITGPILLNADLTIQRSWFNFPSAIKIFLRLTNLYLLFYKFSKSFFFTFFYLGRKPAFMVKEILEDCRMDYLTFAAILINRDVIQNIGKLDEGLFFYQEDCEYGLRAKKNNYEFIYCVSSKIIHLGGSSSSKFSWLAFENDIMGLLHIYKKHYSQNKFKQIKWITSFALKYRVISTNFGFYKQLRNSGLYKKNTEIKPEESLRNKYITLITKVRNYG